MTLLMGAAPDTGNQGVSALCLSAIDGLSRRGVGPITIADHGRGLRAERWMLSGRALDVRRIGVTHHRRIWRGDCLRTVRMASRFGGAGNAAAAVVWGAEAVLDVSGGDSFTDIYGAKRFHAMCLTKRLALEAGRPLILLPQTLGPFRNPAARAEAAEILRAATAVWVRDSASYTLLQDMLGADFDPSRHHAGVDMALLLPREQASLPDVLSGWLAQAHRHPIAGLNVSGLLCREAEAAKAQFGLKSDHRDAVDAVARAVLGAPEGFRLVLVPHVLRDPAHPESDWAAAKALEARLLAEFPDRVLTLPQDYSASQLKGLIAQLSWFAGARMHATIAAFSSGVPTLGLGYSDKASGVFTSCGLGAHVADLRTTHADEIGAMAATSIASREIHAARLARDLGGVLARAEAQMDAIASLVHGACQARAA